VANIKSQIKRNRTNEARRLRNKAVRTSLKTDAKKVRVAAAADQPEAPELLRTATRQLDRAASKGVLHKRTAARRKSRLARRVAAASAATE
jgi:small subunit ribosomal protein S20